MKHRLAAPLLASVAAACSAADTGGAAPGEAPQAAACPVLESRAWTAWINAMPGQGPGAQRRLHIQGEVDLPTPGYTVSWRLGPADRRQPPAQLVDIAFKAPDGPVAQVIATEALAFETEAVYPAYRALKIRCGETLLAEITEIEEVF